MDLPWNQIYSDQSGFTCNLRNAVLTRKEYEAIPLAEEVKNRLKLRIINEDDEIFPEELLGYIDGKSVVIFVLGYGNPLNPLEIYSKKAISLLTELKVEFKAIGKKEKESQLFFKINFLKIAFLLFEKMWLASQS